MKYKGKEMNQYRYKQLQQAKLSRREQLEKMWASSEYHDFMRLCEKYTTQIKFEDVEGMVNRGKQGEGMVKQVNTSSNLPTHAS